MSSVKFKFLAMDFKMRVSSVELEYLYLKLKISL